MKTNDQPTHHRRSPRKCRFTIRYRAIFASLCFLCIPFFIYHLVPSFTNATDNMIAKLFGSPNGGEFCTREIGNFACCTLYLEAMPCMEECRREHMDRETMELTLEYEVCEDACLRNYNSTCGAVVQRQEVELALRGV